MFTSASKPSHNVGIQCWSSCCSIVQRILEVSSLIQTWTPRARALTRRSKPLSHSTHARYRFVNLSSPPPSPPPLFPYKMQGRMNATASTTVTKPHYQLLDGNPLLTHVSPHAASSACECSCFRAACDTCSGLRWRNEGSHHTRRQPRAPGCWIVTTAHDDDLWRMIAPDRA